MPLAQPSPDVASCRGMDLVRELEAGTLAAPPAAAAVDAVRTAEVVRAWAAELKLRPGNTQGPQVRALVPVVGRWAEQRGWTGAGSRELGKGLAWAGLRRRMVGERGAHHVLVHLEDARLLWRMAREAWAPALPPGDPRARTAYARERRKRKAHTPRPRLERRPFHEELRSMRGTPRPVVDSLGRVWPSPVVAARWMGGSQKALGNSVAWLRAALSGGPGTDSSALHAAISRGAAWRGLWWRHLTPSEVAAVPAGHLSGLPLPGLGWGLVCGKCGCTPAGG